MLYRMNTFCSKSTVWKCAIQTFVTHVKYFYANHFMHACFVFMFVCVCACAWNWSKKKSNWKRYADRQSIYLSIGIDGKVHSDLPIFVSPYLVKASINLRIVLPAAKPYHNTSIFVFLSFFLSFFHALCSSNDIWHCDMGRFGAFR